MHHLADGGDLPGGLLQFLHRTLGSFEVARVDISNRGRPARELLNGSCGFFTGAEDQLRGLLLVVGALAGLLGHLAALRRAQGHLDAVHAQLFQGDAQALHELVEQARRLAGGGIALLGHASGQVALGSADIAQHVHQSGACRDAAAWAHQPGAQPNAGQAQQATRQLRKSRARSDKQPGGAQLAYCQGQQGKV